MGRLAETVQGIAAFILAGAILLVGAALGLAFLGIALVVALGTALAVKLGHTHKPSVGTKSRREKIWNDGRGTIIDM